MSQALVNVDWDLLHEQKLTMLTIRARQRDGSPEAGALSGIIHLLDALQDEAVEQGRWRFPETGDNRPGGMQ